MNWIKCSLQFLSALCLLPALHGSIITIYFLKYQYIISVKQINIHTFTKYNDKVCLIDMITHGKGDTNEYLVTVNHKCVAVVDVYFDRFLPNGNGDVNLEVGRPRDGGELRQRL